MSYQHLGNGLYRVGGARRSAITGRYITEEEAMDDELRPAIRALKEQLRKDLDEGNYAVYREEYATPEEYGWARALRDKRRINSRPKGLKTTLYAFWLGFTAPLLFTRAGWAYNVAMRGKKEES